MILYLIPVVFTLWRDKLLSISLKEKMKENIRKGKYNFDLYWLDKRFPDFDKRIKDSDLFPEDKKLDISFKKKAYATGLMRKHRILRYEVFFKNYVPFH